MTPRPRRILIVHASIGSGHKAAANAIREALEASHPEWELSMVDTVETSKVNVGGEISVVEPSRVARESKSRFLQMREKMPRVTGAVVDAGDHDWSVKRTLGAFTSSTALVTQPLQRITGVVKPGVVHLQDFMELLEKARFDLVISTHFFSAHALSMLKDKQKCSDIVSFVVVTDYHAHKTWKCRHVDNYFVPAPDVEKEIDEWYLNRTNKERKPPVKVSGIPVSPKIVEVSKLDKLELRKSLGLPHNDHDTKVVLATLTSENLADSTLAWLRIVAWASKNPKHCVVLIAGRLAKERLERDEYGRRKLAKNNSEGLDDTGRKMAMSVPNVNVLGFTTQMPEYMRASDVIISKPGGLTVAESLAFGLAWVIIKPWLLDVERPNADYLEREDIAKLVDDVSEIEMILQDGTRGGDEEGSGWLATAQASARYLAYPEAATAVVQSAEEIFKNRIPA